MAEILPIRCKTLFNHSSNRSFDQDINCVQGTTILFGFFFWGGDPKTKLLSVTFRTKERGDWVSTAL